MASSLSNHQLQAVPIGILEIDAMVFARTSGDDDAVLFQIGLERLVTSAGHVQGQVIEVVARFQWTVPLLPEQGDPLLPRVQEHLPVVLAIDDHTENVCVELPGAGDVTDMQHEMVDSGGLYHRLALLGNSDPVSIST